MRLAAVPFVIVMLRRVAGFSDTEVLYTTVAHFTGGVASLYVWGRVVDRVGTVAVLRVTTLGQGLLIASLVSFGVLEDVVPLMVLWFFALSVLASGHGVADTHVLFELTPPEAPARTLVLGAVGVGLVAGGRAGGGRSAAGVLAARRHGRRARRLPRVLRDPRWPAAAGARAAGAAGADA